MCKAVSCAILSAVLFGSCLSAAESQWQRHSPPTGETVAPFHSTQSIVLPTAETLGRRLLLFEISHRFLPHFSDGHDVLWALDGPANIRFGLGYGISNRLMVTAGRSNLMDNFDLSAKYDLLHTSRTPFPLAAAIQVGGAWNTEVPQRDAGHSRNFQYYAQLILNASFFDRLSLGVVPSFSHNYDIMSESAENEITVGLYSRFRTTRIMSLLVEWNAAESSYSYEYDAVSFGFEMETGGHFFKMVASNSTTLNLSQYLPGTAESADPKNWHFGFLITRLLKI
ncbi:MAG: hypothetical protein KKA81_16675 [Bacteroidetes bacterium]|nr:hypothetical protein [Bacteroidota bacterium]